GHPLDWLTRVELVIVNGEIAFAGDSFAGIRGGENR
ncbi:MAG: hypothetical protein PWP44_982, partial [Thermacetogenium sp.]|nr:hypothetical protein [Thermacetogenium sp.]